MIDKLISPPGRTDKSIVRLGWSICFISISMMLIYLLNNIVPSIDLGKNEWIFPKVIPTFIPVGIDFRLGIYEPAGLLLEGKSPYSIPNCYPPFVALFGTLFAFLEFKYAYLLQILLLFITNLATIYLSLKIVTFVYRLKVGANQYVELICVNSIFIQLAFLTVTSYGFIFSLERGNYDIFPQFLIVLVIWLMIHKPDQIWIQVLLLAVATHLKIYPAIIYPLIFWLHRGKSVLPFAITNTLLLVILGAGCTTSFFSWIATVVQHSYLWIGNHSAASFAETVLKPKGLYFPYASLLFAIVPVGIWFSSAVVLWRRGYSMINIILLFIVSVPVMHLLPATSHDYKLVILTAPLAMYLCGLLLNFSLYGKREDFLIIVFLMVVFGLIARPESVTTSLWLKNKYLFILAFQLIVFMTIIKPVGFFCASLPDRKT